MNIDWRDEFAEFWFKAPVKPISEEVNLICNWFDKHLIAPLSAAQPKEAIEGDAVELTAINFCEWCELQAYHIKGMDDWQRRVIYKQFEKSNNEHRTNDHLKRDFF